MTVPTFNHGTISGYSRGCRCIDCRGAQRDYMRAYRARKDKETRRLYQTSIVFTAYGDEAAERLVHSLHEALDGIWHPSVGWFLESPQRRRPRAA